MTDPVTNAEIAAGLDACERSTAEAALAASSQRLECCEVERDCYRDKRQKAEAALAVANEERDEARRECCARESQSDETWEQSGPLCVSRPYFKRTPRQVAEQRWPATADRLFPAGGGK